MSQATQPPNGKFAPLGGKLPMTSPVGEVVGAVGGEPGMRNLCTGIWPGQTFVNNPFRKETFA